MPREIISSGLSLLRAVYDARDDCIWLQVRPTIFTITRNASSITTRVRHSRRILSWPQRNLHDSRRSVQTKRLFFRKRESRFRTGTTMVRYYCVCARACLRVYGDTAGSRNFSVGKSSRTPAVSHLYGPVTEKSVGVVAANHGRRETVERTSESDLGRVRRSHGRGLSPVEYPTAKWVCGVAVAGASFRFAIWTADGKCRARVTVTKNGRPTHVRRVGLRFSDGSL